jgi:uncharacterized protein YdiU (UPF0061 family)
MSLDAPLFEFENSYAQQLPGFYVDWQAEKSPTPKLLHLNDALAVELGLDPVELAGPEGLAVFAGVETPPSAHPLAQVYAGHQFGGFSAQLGDGRALLLGEMIDQNGLRRDIQLKGSGRTPFSRGGDGKAAIGPVLREYLIGEAMYGLNIPTTRALAAVVTGEMVQRERSLPGAVLTRVAASHLRVGTFQFFAARGEADKIKQLADYAIARHYPALADAENPYLALLEAVVDAQAELIARWMHVGFIHGVMNTDNMTISGETIDYGPCAFMDHYDPATVFSSIDHQGRYAFANQPVVGQWNLARFAETLLGLIDDDAEEAARIATNVINGFSSRYEDHWLAGMRAKIWLGDAQEADLELINQLLALLHAQEADYTNSFRSLGSAVRGDDTLFRAQLSDAGSADNWLSAWHMRRALSSQDNHLIAAGMDRINPIYVARNHKVEAALSAAESGDLSLFSELLAVLENPFEERDGLDDFARPALADAAPYKTFCGT